MEKLPDDLLSLILKKIDDKNDRKSFSQVCKRWLRVEGIHRSSIQVFQPDLLPNFLPRFPNLLSFQSSVSISNPLIQLLANTCPRIQVLDLNYKELGNYSSLNLREGDFDDEGLCDIARGCTDLRTVKLGRRVGIGNVGVISLVCVSKNLRDLDLSFCRGISDEALESIAELHHLEVLNLEGCFFITDAGLEFIAEGPLCRTLKVLNLAECDQITDWGLRRLRNLGCLEELNLAYCGSSVTDKGGLYVAQMFSLKKLNLSWLRDVSDLTIVTLAENCFGLEELDLTGCESVTRDGLFAFRVHGSLKELVLTRCDHGMTGDDLALLVLACSTLKRIVLDGGLRTSIPETVQDMILRMNCVLDWE